MLCLNLCELYNGQLAQQDNQDRFVRDIISENGKPFERIYIGSSFCSQYFLQFSGYRQLFELCEQLKVPITLTVPVFSEKDLAAGKERISQLCNDGAGIIDEVTVNDMGMLDFFQNKTQYQINLGRLFFKDSRDCRIPEYNRREITPALLSHLTGNDWKIKHFSGIELDPTNQILNLSYLSNTSMEIGIHEPFCYMTTGNICKFASVHRGISQKFRPNSKCRMECQHIIETYSGFLSQTGCSTVINRLGRTLYYEADPPVFIGKQPTRRILLPVWEWRKFCNENTGSPK